MTCDRIPGFYVTEAGSMVKRQRREGGRRKQNTRKFIDKNGLVKQVQTVDKEKNKKV